MGKVSGSLAFAGPRSASSLTSVLLGIILMGCSGLEYGQTK